MDPMLSPGFSIPSIGTPLHQMEADQQIVANPVYHPSAMNQHNNHDMNTNGAANNMYSHDLSHIMGGNSPAPGSNTPNMAQQHPTLPVPHKQMQTYQPSYQSSMSSATPSSNVMGTQNNASTSGSGGGAAPQSLMQPQTPQSLMSPMVPMSDRTDNLSNIHQTMGPATPMTPMTPGSADPGIVPQLQ